MHSQMHLPTVLNGFFTTAQNWLHWTQDVVPAVHVCLSVFMYMYKKVLNPILRWSLDSLRWTVISGLKNAINF